MSQTGWTVGGVSTGWRVGAPSLTHLPYGSVEALRVEVLNLHDPAAQPATKLAVVPDRTTPDPGDWVTAPWADGWSKVQLNGGLPIGRYVVWVTGTHDQDRFIRQAGALTITPGPGIQPPPGALAGYTTARLGAYLGSPPQ